MDQSEGILEGVDSRGLPVRVLVVDDEAITRKLIIQVLKSVGYERFYIDLTFGEHVQNCLKIPLLGPAYKAEGIILTLLLEGIGDMQAEILS